MHPDRHAAHIAAAAIVALLVLGATACGGKHEPVRIGVLVDCTGPFAGLHDGLLASAELPVLERGGRLVDKPHGVVAEGTVAGHNVQVFEGCSETGVFSRLIAETRRLVEQEHLDVLVGPLGDTDGLILRGYLRRHPEVTAVLGASAAQATTLRRPTPNLFRFTPDGAQASAGLGSYVYKTLGWRTAEVIDDAFAYSWEGAAGFIAEFCSLGGNIVGRTEAPLDDPERAATQITPRADGTAVLLSGLSSPIGLFRALARRGPAAQTVVTSRATIADPTVLQSVGRLLAGVVVASDTPADGVRWQDFQRRFHRAFPGQPVGIATGLGLYSYNAMNAVLKALDTVHGDLGDGRRFRNALGQLTLDAPEGRITLDSHRQAVLSNYLLQVGSGGLLHTIRVLRDVEQTYSGYLSEAPEPSATTPVCKAGPIPAWAR
jgi:branched-chain amino acid transport system substrate-binding protein